MLRLHGEFVQESVGQNHRCGITPIGTVRCRGSNAYGQLGDGTTTDRAQSVLVSGLVNANIVSVGVYHTCASFYNGIRCWGRNDFGQLGDGTTTQRTTPTPLILGTYHNLLSAGHLHTCAGITNSTYTCWGSNQFGQLGDGTHINRLSPTWPTPLQGLWSVQAELDDTCVDGLSTFRCWGASFPPGGVFYP